MARAVETLLWLQHKVAQRGPILENCIKVKLLGTLNLRKKVVSDLRLNPLGLSPKLPQMVKVPQQIRASEASLNIYGHIDGLNIETGYQRIEIQC